MIETFDQAISVQSRRFMQGKKGRAKAVRRWFKRNHGRAVEAHSGPVMDTLLNETVDVRTLLKFYVDFEGCRSFHEAHPETFKGAEKP